MKLILSNIKKTGIYCGLLMLFTLTTHSGNVVKANVLRNLRWRKITVRECER